MAVKNKSSRVGEYIIKTSDGKNIVVIKEARLYKIIQGSQSQTHTIELKIRKPRLKRSHLILSRIQSIKKERS